MRRVLALLAAATIATAGCADAFEPPDASGATEAPTSQSTPSPTPASTAPPLEVGLGDLPTEGADELHVIVLGWLRTGGSVFCRGDACYLELVNPRDPSDEVSLAVSTDGDGPNTMTSLGSGFEESDLEVTAADGSVLRSGDHVLVTGWWSPDSKTLTPEAIARGTAPRLTPVATSFAQLKSRKQGTLVKVSGRLETPFLLSCGGRDGTCNLYLRDTKNDARSLRIEVRLARKGETRPNTMRPLPKRFTDANLRVFDAKKKTARAGDRISVVGWLYRTDDGTPYLEPVQSISRLGS